MLVDTGRTVSNAGALVVFSLRVNQIGILHGPLLPAGIVNRRIMGSDPWIRACQGPLNQQCVYVIDVSAHDLASEMPTCLPAVGTE